MTVNPKEFELRNLLGDKPDDVKFTCGVCGKPHATLTKEAKELPMHKRALAEDWAGKFRNLSKQLGKDQIMDFATRKHFNAQLEWLRGVLVQAREEHDAMPPKPEKALTGSAKTRKLLTESLKLLGVDMGTGDHGIDGLAVKLHEQLHRLMQIGTEAHAAAAQPVEVKAPAQVQADIPTL